jgi:hypothetical protein
MSRFTYSQQLDRRYVVKQELDGMFSDLQTWWNTPSLDESNMEPGAVEYRHIDRPLSIELAAKFSGPSLTFGALFGGYYPIDQSLLTVNLGTVTSYDNRYEETAPVAFIKAKLHQTVGTAASPNNITRYCIGYSIDAGVTWVPLATRTYRPVGPGNGGWAIAGFVGTQLDYMTGVAGYEPVNYNYDHRIVLLASVGGTHQDVSANGARLFCVMANQNSFGDGWISGDIEFTARWDKDSP